MVWDTGFVGDAGLVSEVRRVADEGLVEVTVPVKDVGLV